MDEAIRRLERAYQASGEAGDRERLSRALLRLADPAKLALAVQLRDPTALQVRPCKRPYDWPTRRWLMRFCGRLWRYGHVPCVIAAAGAARYESERQLRARRPLEEQALEAVEDWAASPDSVRLRRCARFAPAPEDRSAVAEAVRAATAPSPRASAAYARRAMGVAEACLPHLARIPTRQEHHEALYATLRVALLQWAGTWRP